MVSRATHYRNKARHSQRVFATEKPRLQPRGTDTIWVPEWIDSIQRMEGHLTVYSVAVLPLGDTLKEREEKLRQATRMGLLHMTAHREDGVFIEYRWQLTESATR